MGRVSYKVQRVGRVSSEYRDTGEGFNRGDVEMVTGLLTPGLLHPRAFVPRAFAPQGFEEMIF